VLFYYVMLVALGGRLRLVKVEIGAESDGQNPEAAGFGAGPAYGRKSRTSARR
jgi:hypothetical protein